MSMHEIEGLIEDSVHLIDKAVMQDSVKRDFLFNLYRFQARYDTGYTHFRCMEVLLRWKFTYRIPISLHPDFEKEKPYFEEFDVSNSCWIPSRIGEKNEQVYVQLEAGAPMLYPDAGSYFWQRLCEENSIPATQQKTPNTFKESYLIGQLLRQAQRQENKLLLRDWYALVTNMLGLDLGEEEGFLPNFLEFKEQEEVQTIREIGIGEQPFSAVSTDAYGALETPLLTEIEEYETNVERLYCIKWLLDFETKDTTIIDSYLKAVSPDPSYARKMQLLPALANTYLDIKKWQLVWESEYEYGYKWLYHHQMKGTTGLPADTDMHLYYYFTADSKDLKLLHAKIGVQNGLLNRWQGRNVVHRPDHVHFFETIFAFMSDKEYDQNKSLHNMGGWKFNVKNSEKTLHTHICNMFECLDRYAPKVIKEFKKPLFDSFKMSVEEALAYREKKQYTHRFFLNKVEVYLVYAIHYFEQGEIERSHALAAKAKTEATTKQHKIVHDWLAAATSILEGNPKLNELLGFERSYS